MKIEDYMKKQAEGRSPHDSKDRRELYSYWPKKGKDCLKAPKFSRETGKHSLQSRSNQMSVHPDSGFCLKLRK